MKFSADEERANMDARENSQSTGPGIDLYRLASHLSRNPGAPPPRSNFVGSRFSVFGLFSGKNDSIFAVLVSSVPHVTRTKSFPPLVLFKTKFSVSQRVWNCEFFSSEFPPRLIASASLGRRRRCCVQPRPGEARDQDEGRNSSRQGHYIPNSPQ